MFQKNVKPKKLQQEKQNVQLHKHRLTDIAGKCDNNFKNKVPGCAIRQADLFVDDRISCVNTGGGGGIEEAWCTLSYIRKWNALAKFTSLTATPRQHGTVFAVYLVASWQRERFLILSVLQHKQNKLKSLC